MKLSKIAVAMGLGMSLVCGMANAAASGTVTPSGADQGHGHITFNGSIIDAPCSIAPDSVDQTVPLGQVANSALKDGGESTPVPFQIKLENCDITTSKSVQVTWSGASDNAASGASDKMLGITGTAKGAGIMLKDASEKDVTFGTATPAQKLVAQDNVIQMSAYLKGDGATINPGDFTGAADFTLSYQ